MEEPKKELLSETTEVLSDVATYRMSQNPNDGLPFFIRKYTLKKGQILAPVHRHDCMQINYIWRGRAKHHINSSEFLVIKGDVFVIPPFVNHAISGGEVDAEIIEFEFMPEFINNNFTTFENAESFLDFAYIEPFLEAENLVKPRLNLIGKEQVEIENALNECLLEYDGKRPGYILVIKSLLLKILVSVGREFTNYLENSQNRTIYDRHRDAILGAMDYINGHYQEEISIDEVAKKFMLSPSYFSYLFKSITSKTFTEYVNTLRIASTQKMLKTTDKLVVDICYEAGFNNVNHFNRMFKQCVGMSPKQYRRAKRDGEPIE